VAPALAEGYAGLNTRGGIAVPGRSSHRAGLVWAIIGEEPTRMALLGAAIILAALIYDTLPERRAVE
jgi:drug/metabolite transporter (DMT)-like permease